METKKPFLTIFTPIYNRAYIITKLYESLCRQTCDDFEWLIVNDGSTDNINELISKFQAENKITIRYLSQPNGGKHRAINNGVKHAQGVMFFIVDSDDYLTSDAVNFIKKEWNSIVGKDLFCGISGLRIRPDGKTIGSKCVGNHIDCSVIDYRFKLRITGDKAEAWITSILQDNLFPEIEGENFITESIVWNRIGAVKQVRYTNHPIYICDYQKDGLTAKMSEIRYRNPKGAMMYYYEESHLPISFKFRYKSIINYWRFALSDKGSSFMEKARIAGIMSFIALPVAIMMRIKDLRI